jgi:hypothetical protein
MASMESLGLMLFTIEIMKERLTSSGLSRLTLAFGHAQAIVRRGQARAISMVGEDFEPQSQPTRPLLRSDGRLQDSGTIKECR